MRELFESTLERLLADAAPPGVALAAEGGVWAADLWSAVEDSGFALAAVPEASGGAGASWDDLYVVLRVCGRHSAPVPLPEAILANWLLGRAGVEPVTGPLSFVAQPLAAPVNGHLSARAGEVPWGRDVDHVVAVTDGPQPGVVLLAMTAVKYIDRRQNIAGEPRDDLVFDGAAIVAQAPLPADLRPDVLLQGGALLRAAQSAGALQAVLELTTRYAIERVQFGRPIGNFQAIQHQIAQLAEHAAMASVAAEAACAESNETLALLPIASAKVCSAEAAGVGASIAHAVHGAIGFTHEHVLHLSTRRLWSWRSEFGSLAHWSQRLGRAACAVGSRGFWPGLVDGRFPQGAGDPR